MSTLRSEVLKSLVIALKNKNQHWLLCVCGRYGHISCSTDHIRFLSGWYGMCHLRITVLWGAFLTPCFKEEESEKWDGNFSCLFSLVYTGQVKHWCSSYGPRRDIICWDMSLVQNCVVTCTEAKKNSWKMGLEGHTGLKCQHECLWTFWVWKPGPKMQDEKWINM